MSEFITRAEQGVLAALLAGDDQRLLTEHLSGSDFADPTHRAIYQAIVELDPAERAPDRIVTAVAAHLPELMVDPAWVRRLTEQAPEPERASAYAQIIVQAAFDRDVAEFANPYLAAAEESTDPQVRTSLNRLGQALNTRAEAFALDEPTAEVTVEAGRGLHREDQVIADLLQHPEQARAVAEWLDSEVFTTEQRKVTFEIAVSLAYDHDPIDAVILTWHVEQARSLTVLQDRPPHPDPGWENQYSYLTGLESTPVPPGTAIVVGRELLAEHLRATVAVSATQAAERAAQAQAEMRGVGGRVEQVAAEAPLTVAPQIDIRPIER